jgi:hypothetical protein
MLADFSPASRHEGFGRDDHSASPPAYLGKLGLLPTEVNLLLRVRLYRTIPILITIVMRPAPKMTIERVTSVSLPRP